MTAPQRTLRQSPSGRKLGVYGFARISLSAPVAYLATTPKQIPFDRIDEMTDGFGDIVSGGLLSAAGAFRLTDTGLYLVNTFVAFDTSATLSALALGGAGTVIGSDSAGANVLGLSGVGNAVVSALTPAPVGDISSVLTVTGSAGNITSATCLILQIN